jgi:hypothetical protein
MKLAEEEADINQDEQMVLSLEVVKKVELTRKIEKHANKQPTWGLVLVERQRRKKHEGSMLQKAMDLKKEKNWNLLKVILFSGLQYNDLNQIAIDASVSLGDSIEENFNLIDNLVNVDRE